MPKTNVTYNSWGDPIERTGSSGETVWGDPEAFPSTSAPAPAPGAGTGSDSGGGGTSSFKKQASFPTQIPTPSQDYTQEQDQTSSFPIGQDGFPVFTRKERRLMFAMTTTVPVIGLFGGIVGYQATSRYLLRSFPTLSAPRRGLLSFVGSSTSAWLVLKASKPAIGAFVRSQVDDPAQFVEKIRFAKRHVEEQTEQTRRLQAQRQELLKASKD